MVPHDRCSRLHLTPLPQMTKTDYCEYFGVVNEAGLLPRAREDLDEWRERLRRWVRDSATELLSSSPPRRAR